MNWLIDDRYEAAAAASSNERKSSNKRKHKKQAPESRPTPEDLSQLASLIAKEGRLKDGDDSTIIVVYVCPIRGGNGEASVRICSNSI